MPFVFSEEICITEMTALLMCLKTNDYAEGPCAAESKALSECNDKSRVRHGLLNLII